MLLLKYKGHINHSSSPQACVGAVGNLEIFTETLWRRRNNFSVSMSCHKWGGVWLQTINPRHINSIYLIVMFGKKKYWKTIGFQSNILVYWLNGKIYNFELPCISNMVCFFELLSSRKMENNTPSSCLVTIIITNMCITR